tara:strand:+ start:909 stop:1790 length:882 start_codon:yes stop_codon:yes gene_type:complete
MANIKFSDFTNEAVAVDTTELVGFKDGDTTANYRYTMAQVAVGILAADSGFTEGSVIFCGADGVLTQDNTNFFFADSTNRLGVGVNDPDSTLELLSGDDTQLKCSYDADSFATIAVADASHTTFATGESGNLTLDVAGITSIDSTGNVTIDADTGVITFADGGASLATVASLRQESFIMAASDETTALTAATDVATFRMPYAFTLTAVRASLTTAGTGVNLVTVDIHESGTTILSTKITIDATETTSYTAATPPVISDTSLAVDAEMTVDIDQIDSGGVSAGLKVTLIGYQTP